MSTLCYHAVDPVWKSSLTISPAEFEAPLAWLARARTLGYSHSFAPAEHHELMGPRSVPRVGVYPGNGVFTLRANSHPSCLSLRHSAAFSVMRAAVGRP